jgi:predicted Fe-Mo cluster-binding NifX family protein
MKIAVSVDKKGAIAPHLGKCKLFHIYKKEGNNIEFFEEIETDGNYQNHIIEDIMDCDYVISAQIGEGMIENLKSVGIEPVVSIGVSSIEAVKALGLK